MNKKYSPTAGVALGAAALVVLSGCSTSRMPEYHAGTPAGFAATTSSPGVQVTLDAFADRERTEQYFGINAAAEGIGIVYVRASNNTTNQTYIVEKKDFQLVLPGAASTVNIDTNSIQRSQAGGTATAYAGAVIGGLGGVAIMLAGGAAISHATEVQRNFVGKEMPDQTLAPGETMDGFIFFRPVPKKATWPEGATVKINLPATRNDEPLAMTMPLSR